MKELGSAAAPRAPPADGDRAVLVRRRRQGVEPGRAKGLADRSADEWRAARTLAVLNISLADAVIATFDTKFHYNYWRPITAIRAGDDDGNWPRAATRPGSRSA